VKAQRWVDAVIGTEGGMESKKFLNIRSLSSLYNPGQWHFVNDFKKWIPDYYLWDDYTKKPLDTCFPDCVITAINEGFELLSCWTQWSISTVTITSRSFANAQDDIATQSVRWYDDTFGFISSFVPALSSIAKSGLRKKNGW